jgi:hypothetical protein
METQILGTADSSQLVIIQKKLSLDNKIRNGVNWFFWIAGLSLLNTVIYLFGSTISFVTGLGATQIVDGVMSAIAKDLGQSGIIVRLIGFAIDIGIAGIFVVFGVLGRKRIRWPIIAGIILYTIDGIVLLLFRDILGAAFHGLALFGLVGSLKSIAELGILEKSGGSESIESIRQRLPSQTTPAQRRLRWILVGLILLVFAVFFIGSALQPK